MMSAPKPYHRPTLPGPLRTPQPSAIATNKPAGLPTIESTKSFWHTQPSALLTGHRTTRELPATADVVIIGTGITGASVAHHLLTTTKQTLKVVLLEAREACWGATGRNGGHCQPLLFSHPQDPDIGHFELKNFFAIESLVKQNKINCEFVAQPGIQATFDHASAKAAEAHVAAARARDPELGARMRFITDKDELRKLRVPSAIAAVDTNIAARMWPYKFVARVIEDLLTSTENAGSLNLQTLTPVESLTQLGSGGVQVHTTDRGTITARRVILATNAYTSHLLPDFADLIVPCRGQMTALVAPPSVSGASRLQTSLGFEFNGGDDYLIQRPTGRGEQLMFGGGRQCGPSIGITDDNAIDSNTAAYLRRRPIDALSLPGHADPSPSCHHKRHPSKPTTTASTTCSEGEFPHDPTLLDASHIWTGIMGYSRDSHPWVGRSPVPGHRDIFLSAGYTGHGMPNAWLCGAAVAGMAVASLKAEAAGAASVEDGMEEGVLECLERKAGEAVELPRSYYITPARVVEARKRPSVERRDWDGVWGAKCCDS